MDKRELEKQILTLMAAYDFSAISTREVERCLARENIGLEGLVALLSPAAAGYLEPMAHRAKRETARFFGRNISLYTPTYISNYCQNECVYCGYNCKNKIKRAKLTFEEIEAEAQAIAATGLKDILLLTGESRKASGVEYIGQAVLILKKYFNSLGIEIYPLEEDEYRYLHSLGVDFISVYQETYDPILYDQVHLAGPKKNYSYRFDANYRALAAGFRGASFGALLGLGDFRRDALACAAHGHFMRHIFPHAEIGFSFPRLRPYPNKERNEQTVTERDLLQVILAFRLFEPSAGLSLSTRESAYFRDNCIGLGITRLSAGVCTGVGGHSQAEKGDAQFHKSDERDVEEMLAAILSRGYQPVFNDYVRV